MADSRGDAATLDAIEAIRAEVRPHTSFLLRWTLIGVGSAFVAIGVVGIILPLLPSTVFFLIAAACYGRSSPSAYAWLLTNKWFGNELREYHKHRAATMRTKVVAITTLWAAILFAIWFVGPPAWAWISMLVVATAVTTHLVRLKTLRR